jgi:hypothetical protein
MVFSVVEGREYQRCANNFAGTDKKYVVYEWNERYSQPEPPGLSD